MKLSVQPLDPILLDSRRAAAACGVSRSTWLGWDAAGWCPRAIRLGGRVLWCASDLRRWARMGCPSREVFEQQKDRPE